MSAPYDDPHKDMVRDGDWLISDREIRRLLALVFCAGLALGALAVAVAVAVQ